MKKAKLNQPRLMYFTLWIPCPKMNETTDFVSEFSDVNA